MSNKIILECWDEEGIDGKIVLDYVEDEDDERDDVVGMVMELEEPVQRISLFKKDLLLAIKQLSEH